MLVTPLLITATVTTSKCLTAATIIKTTSAGLRVASVRKKYVESIKER